MANQAASDGSWLWRDRNGDGSIQSNEHESLGAEDDSVWGWEVDSKGTSGKLPSLAVYGIIGFKD